MFVFTAASKEVKALPELDKLAIQSYRDSVSHRREHPARKPIFDRSRLPKTIGQLAARQEAIETTRFTSFGAMVAQELQKAAL
ncbi:unnamed protein product [Sphagnum jensenii]|uniref:Uncharacterized protein n=1 Tax=Sphagnum jensenii TaxID=128206 RepID=A0ABP0V5C9_9BRYO